MDWIMESYISGYSDLIGLWKVISQDIPIYWIEITIFQDISMYWIMKSYM